MQIVRVQETNKQGRRMHAKGAQIKLSAFLLQRDQIQMKQK